VKFYRELHIAQTPMNTAAAQIAHAITDISATPRISAANSTSMVGSARVSSQILNNPSEMKPLRAARITASDRNAFHPDESALVNGLPHELTAIILEEARERVESHLSAQGLRACAPKGVADPIIDDLLPIETPFCSLRRIHALMRRPMNMRLNMDPIDRGGAMGWIERVFLASFFLTLAVAIASADDFDHAVGGFDFCVRPLTPRCVDAPSTYRVASDVQKCQHELERFVVATTAYRDCLERQIASAMRPANDMIDRFRCLSERHGSCRAASKSP
jgi:hypothetical protein